ncbi:MAG: recombination regulator RecX [Oscillospiraceae bacterium]|jgi:SOS response regulatory protein OraA/RecX|nr:recombination regulator RecX [Oscillospiraceae bacterium]
MEIIDIQPFKNSLFYVLLDTRKRLYVSKEIIIKYELEIGKILDIVEVKEIYRESLFFRAMLKANNMLAKRAYSVKEMMSKITDAFNEELAERVIEELVKADLLDDKKYAAELAYSYCEVKQYGKIRAIQNMRNHGLDEDICKTALEKYNLNTVDRIVNIIKVRFSTEIQADKYNQKIKNRLYARGYSFEDINTAIKKYLEDSE